MSLQKRATIIKRPNKLAQKVPRMEGVTAERLISRANMRVEKVTVCDLKENTYYAEIDLWQGQENFLIDSRPSDAIALAVRMESPIFVSQAVLDKCPVIRKPISDDEVEDFKKQIQSLRPEDFFKDTEDSSS